MSTNWRELRKTIKGFSNKYLLAVSGGADSMFMLDFFYNNSADIVVAHYNHGMRDTSDNERILVEEYCNKRGIPFFYENSTSLDKDSNEQEARNARWNFLESVARSNGITTIVTGHHADDQIENIFIRLMRGDPHNSLMMRPFHIKNDFVRFKPFLNISKKAIYDQCKRKNIPYIEDESNKSNKYDRNFIRNVIIPAFNQRTNIKSAMFTGIKRSLENGL